MVKVLGIVFLLGAVIVIASKSKATFVPWVHFNIPSSSSSTFALTQENLEQDSQQQLLGNPLRIAPHTEVSKEFGIRYDRGRPASMLLCLQ